jgi:hypothetical protein
MMVLSMSLNLCIIELARRQLKQDAKNAVRAKYNKDKVTASMALNAIASGELSPDDIETANKALADGSAKSFTDACAKLLGIGEDALKNADASHIHWDCAR